MPEPSARSATAVVEPSSSVVRLAGAAPELPQLPDPAEADDLGRTAREYVTGARERLRSWHDAGAAGVAVVECWTRAIDRLIEFLFEAERDRERWVQLIFKLQRSPV